MKLTSCASALVATTLAAASVAAAPASPSPITLHLETTRLANGLEVIFDEDHRTPIVSVNLWYHVGSKNEEAHRNGFAHLFEHVMFQGSKHVPEDTYFRFLEKVGSSSVNGTTSFDRTNYFETVPANQLELALWLESDRMGFLLDHADDATFKSQREVVKNERRQSYENAAYGMTWQYEREELFPPEHPYHFMTIGSPQDLDAASLDDVRAFFRRYYVPNNATLVISGDFDKTKAGALVDKYFAPIPRGQDIPRLKAARVLHLGETRIDVEAGVELGRAQIAWPTPAFFAPGDAELDLLARVLSAGKTSRLYKRLVYDMKIAQDVSAGQQSNELASTFGIVVTALPGHAPDELLKVVDEELTKLRDGGVTPEELARAKTGIVSSRIFDVERSSARANWINEYNHYTGVPDYFATDVARYTSATPETVIKIAREYLLDKGRVVTVTTPKKDAPLSGKLVSVKKGAVK